jgi:adenylate cyclase
MRRSLGVLAVLLLASLFCALYVIDPVTLRELRNITFDQYQRWQPRTYQDAPVRIIDFDDESLHRLGQWPWPRTRIAELVTRLQDAAPAAIAFDVVFSEPDRTSPKAMLDLWSAPAQTRHWMASLPDHDDALARAIAQAPVVLGQSVATEQAAGTAPQVKARFISIGEAPTPYLHAYSGAIPLLPPLENAAAGVGFITFIPDADGVVRRVPLLINVANTLVPSLSAEALRVAQGGRNYLVRSVDTKGVGVADVRVGKTLIKTNSAGEVWMHYSPPEARRYIPAWKILSGAVPASELTGKILFVGTSAKGLLDIRFTPLGYAIPGVEIHAQMLEQTLAGNELVRPSWASGMEAATLMAGVLGVGLAALLLGVLWSSVLFLAVLITLWAGIWYGFSVHGLLIDAMVPSIAIITAYGLASSIRHFSSERRQRWIRQAFSRYVSPNLVAYLINQPGALELGGRRQQCSFVFTDLADFTSLLEGMKAESAVTLINDYLEGMITIAFAHDGTLNRIVGDAVVIMFSAPVVQADHQRRAIACAWEMRLFSQGYAKQLSMQGIAFGQTRIGIHSGEVIVGNFGGNAIFDYRALGDPINTAARLESANKHFGTWVCVSATTLAGCPDWPVRPIGQVVFKGKTIPLMIYELLDPKQMANGDADYETAFALLSTHPASSLAAFKRLAESRPTDALVALHLERLRAGHTDDLIVLTQK